MAKKMDQLTKCVLSNTILAEVNKMEIIGGEIITIEIVTKKNGEVKTITIKKGEPENEN